MGLVLYVLARDLPFWLPTFLAWYWTARTRFNLWLPLAVWMPVALLTALLVGPERREHALVTMAVAASLGTLLGLAQRRPPDA